MQSVLTGFTQPGDASGRHAPEAGPVVLVGLDVADVIEVALEPVALEPVALEPVALEPIVPAAVALAAVALEPFAPDYVLFSKAYTTSV